MGRLGGMADDALLFTNARILTPFRELPGAYLLVVNGKIRELGRMRDLPAARPAGARALDLSGLALVPGLIDIHTHGGYGIDISAHPERVQELSIKKASEGVTGYLPTFFSTLPFDGLLEALDRLTTLIGPANPEGRWEAASAPGATVIGINMEAPFLHPKLGAHSGKFDIEPSPQAIETLLSHGKGLIRIMTIAPELPGAIECITALRARAVIPSIGHSLAEPPLLARAVDCGAHLATHLLNGTFPLSAREPGVVPVGLNEYLLVRDDVWAEFISDTDGAHIHPVVMQILLRCKGVDRLILVTDSMFTAGLPPGPYNLPDGRTIRSDGSVNRLPDGHLTGSAMRMNLSLGSCVRHTGLPLRDALRTATVNPARLLGLETLTGSIQAGLRADLAVIDDACEVQMTVVGGSVAYDRLHAS